MNTNYTKEQILKIFGKTLSNTGDRKSLSDIQIQLGCDTQGNNCKKLAVPARNEEVAIVLINEKLEKLLSPIVIGTLLKTTNDDEKDGLINRMKKLLYSLQCSNNPQYSNVFDCIEKTEENNPITSESITDLNNALFKALEEYQTRSKQIAGRHTRKHKNRKTKYTKKSQKQRRSKTKKTRKN